MIGSYFLGIFCNNREHKTNVTIMCRNDELISELFPILGKIHHMGLRITEKMPKHPRGGTMFLLNTSTFNRGDHADGHQGQNIADGYMWTEILHQSDLITSKENHLDYRHYYISTSLGDGRRRRTSSKFRHSEPELQILFFLNTSKTFQFSSISTQF
jgi:hypothetical protein